MRRALLHAGLKGMLVTTFSMQGDEIQARHEVKWEIALAE